MATNAPLPTPRTLITSLLNTLFTTPPSQPQSQAQPQTRIKAPYTDNKNSTNSDPNPLALFPPSHRALLSTLHVVFPPPTLLQALDLLDRGLVTRLILSTSLEAERGQANASREGERIGNEGLAGSVIPAQADVHLPSQPPSTVKDSSKQDSLKIPEEGKSTRENTLYLVRSSQPSSSKSRYRDPTLSSSSAMIYVVHLHAWNCSCAAFAFSAFPASASYTSSSMYPWNLTPDDEDEEVIEDRGTDEEKEWEFGGLSLDGKGIDGGNGGVPICKHLLACLLAEKWDGVVGRYVKEREVGREEMAGWAAGG